MWFNSGQRVLVLGLAKSGSGQLAKQIALCADAAYMPGAIKMGAVPGTDHSAKIKQIHDYKADKRGLVVQGVVYPQHLERFGDQLKQLCNGFDQILWVHRDPRDRLVSHQLFRWARVPKLKVAKGRADDWHASYDLFAERLARKQAEPLSVPMLTLMAQNEDDKTFGKALSSERAIYQSMPDVIAQLESTEKLTQVTIESFFGSSVVSLAEQLGLKVLSDPTFEQADGNHWSHWFTAVDVAAFEKIYGEYCTQNNYADWQLADEPQIQEALSTKYVKRMYRGANKRLAKRAAATTTH